MALLVSAKGTDVLAWRASGDFAATYRQVLLARLEFCRSEEAEILLSQTGRALDDLVADNDAFCRGSQELIGKVATCAEPARLRELTTVFYAGLYGHVALYHSAAAFYELSTLFLQALSASINRYVHSALGLLVRQMPPVLLVALGPAGRQEFSPFCPLHLLLVHGEAGDAEHEALSQFGRLIHEGFEACGLQVDAVVTPRNHDWRGSMAQWRQRLAQGLELGRVTELIGLFRLADQTTLCGDDGFAPGFRALCRSSLKESRASMTFQVKRVQNLSHGIGMLGGLRFVKKGPCRGQFALRDNALQPLSATIGILALLKGLETATTPQRIREILWRREMNVDMAERLLLAWHTLHGLRLTREREVHPAWSDEAPLYLKVEEMNDSEQHTLRESLDTVGAIQRHVGLTFNGMEG